MTNERMPGVAAVTGSPPELAAARMSLLDELGKEFHFQHKRAPGDAEEFLKWLARFFDGDVGSYRVFLQQGRPYLHLPSGRTIAFHAGPGGALTSPGAVLVTHPNIG